MVLHIYIYVNAQIQAYTYGPHLPIIDLDRPERLHFEKIVFSSNRVENCQAYEGYEEWEDLEGWFEDLNSKSSSRARSSDN